MRELLVFSSSEEMTEEAGCLDKLKKLEKRGLPLASSWTTQQTRGRI